MGGPPFTGAVERPGDEATRSENVLEDAGQATGIANGGSAIVVNVSNNSGSKQEVAYASAASATTADDLLIPKVVVRDEGNNVVNQMSGHLGSWPMTFRPRLPLPDGWSVRLEAVNETGSAQDISGNLVRIQR